MSRKKLVIRRKGHHRRSHIKDVKPGPGVRRKRVKKSYVDRTTYKSKDTGKLGRTPKSKRWYPNRSKFRGKLGEGYVNLPAKRRRAKLRKLDKKRSVKSQDLWYHMGGLRNVSTSKKAKKAFDADQRWVKKNLMNKKESGTITIKARKKWQRMSKKDRAKAMPDRALDRSRRVLKCPYKDCSHEWNPRVLRPKVCPRCRGRLYR